MKYLFGPVPSRRLGLSLGVDILPAKTCNMNCIYCELGRGQRTYSQIRPYTPFKEILGEIKAYIDSGRPFDCLTFTASGEPTLHSHLGVMIQEAKQLTSKPVVVLTNSSLIYRKEVATALAKADLVLPSLDAVSKGTFRRINRPDPSLDIARIVSGLVDFRRIMAGQIWLEILLVKGINDSQEELTLLKEAIDRIQPDKIQLNSVARPPAEGYARPVSQRQMEEIRGFFGPRAEVIIDFKARMEEGEPLILESEILDTLKRRPLSDDDIKKLFGRYKGSDKIMSNLMDKGMIRQETIKDRLFYVADSVGH